MKVKALVLASLIVGGSFAASSVFAQGEEVVTSGTFSATYDSNGELQSVVNMQQRGDIFDHGRGRDGRRGRRPPPPPPRRDPRRDPRDEPGRGPGRGGRTLWTCTARDSFRTGYKVSDYDVDYASRAAVDKCERQSLVKGCFLLRCDRE